MPRHVCHGALLLCSFGIAPSTLTALPLRRVMTSGQPAATILDFQPLITHRIPRPAHGRTTSGRFMLHDLDLTLEALLTRELRGLGQITVSFAAPDDRFHVTPPAVDLFLYDLRENLELRGNDDLLTFEGEHSATRTRPPVRVDASYLITAWPGGAGGESDTAEDEHRLLGAVMRVLLRYRKLPADLLKGSLAAADLPLPATALQPGRLQSLGEFWQALGGKPKAALNYMVTLSVDVDEPEVWPLVVEKEIRLNVLPETVS